jgi:hypothetical protein
VRTRVVSVFAYLLPRIQDAVFVGILIAVSSQGSLLLNGDGDLGRHITIGRYIIESREIPTLDLFSHTMTGQPLVPHEWLSQLAFGGVYAFTGLSGVVLLIAVLIAATFTLTYREMLRRNVFRILALSIAVLAAYTSSLHWLARPHIFTFLFTAIWSYQLENQKSKVWLFPLLMLVWANAHGAFITGFVIWGAHMAGWLWEYLHKENSKDSGIKLALIGVLSFAVTFTNPAGWHLWDTSVGYLGSKFLVDQTVEYQSPNFHNWSTWPFLIMLALGIVASGIGGKLRPHEAFLFAGWSAMSLYSARNIPLFAIITAPYIGTATQGALEKISLLRLADQRIMRIETRLKGVLWPGFAITLLIGSAYIRPNAANRFDPTRFPVQAVDWLQSNPQEGKVFNNFIWGGYLLYRVWPQQTVFIDGQTDFYGEMLAREYTRVMSLDEGWQSVLTKYDVSWVIVQSGQPLVKTLEDEGGWLMVYQDDTATILRRP